MKIVKISKITISKKKDCGGFQKAKGHLDTQMFPECEGTKYDRDIVKKTVEKRKYNKSKSTKSKKQKEACVECMIKEAQMVDPKLPQRPIFSGDKCPKCGNSQHYISNSSTPIINECSLCKNTWNPDNEKWNGKLSFNLKQYKTAQKE